jgi:dihydrofolate reductase
MRKLRSINSMNFLRATPYILGRVTYQIFADAWPTLTDEENLKRVKEAGGDAEAIQADMGKGNPFADRMNSIPKFVVSTTLEEVEWNNSRLIKRNIAEEISKLKRQPGQDILVAGSGDLVHTLMQHDLIDEYRLMVFPVVLGSGKPLFKNIKDRHNPLLANTKAFKSGLVLLDYQP